MSTDIIYSIIEDLVFKYHHYKIYNEGDVISLIKNNILINKDFINEYYIFDEFPVKLKYPRYITKKVFGHLNKSQMQLFEDINYGIYKFIGNEKQGEELMQNIGENIIKKYDVAKVNVDISIIERDRYNKFVESDNFDYNFDKHNFVLEFKYERDPSRKLTNGNKFNKTIYNSTRKDIGQINNNSCDLYRDIVGIKAIVNDGFAENGYFIFVSEGGQFKETYPPSASNYTDYKNGGYIYFYKISKDEELKKIFNLNSK